MLKNKIIQDKKVESSEKEDTKVVEKRTIEHQFDCVCKKVLREERRNIIKKGDREARSLKRAILRLFSPLM